MNNFDGSESGSLFHCMNQTLTLFGSRLLRHWVWRFFAVSLLGFDNMNR